VLQKKLDSLKNFLSEKNVIDIIFFGSAMRGKSFPRDFDVFVLVNEPYSVNQKSKLSVKMKDEGFSPVVMTYPELLENDFLWSLIHEGMSVSFGKIRDKLNMKSYDIFMFRHNLEGSRKVQFYKALRQMSIHYPFGNGVLLVETEFAGLFEEFFETWKVDHIKLPLQMSKNFVGPLKRWFG